MRKHGTLFGRVAFVLLVMAFLAGCARFDNIPHGTVRLVAASPVIEQQPVSVPAMEMIDAPPGEYLLRPDDVLNISVESTLDSAPRASTPSASAPAGASTTPVAPPGRRIDSNGFVSLPVAGKVKVAGLTIEQARDRIEGALMKYFKEPAVVVELSQPLYLLGQFRAPGIHYMDRPVNLLQGIALGGGPDPSANLRGARLVRNNKIVPADIYDVLFKGETRQNIWLKGGDIIYIPDAKNQPVFVFGAVKSPGPVPMVNGQLSLLQALSLSGFGDVSYDHRIRIIRSLSTTRGELILVDYDKIMKGEAMPFMLAEGDIVFVPKSSISNWNAALNELLPTLQAIGAVLNPFVQLKFMLDNNN